MKIESKGFKITDICDAVPIIEVDGGSTVRITVRAANRIPFPSGYLSPAEFAELRDAINAAHERMTANGTYAVMPAPAEPAPAEAPAKRLKDRDGDIWTLRGDDIWALQDDDEYAHPRGWIERCFGPVIELADEDPDPA